ncbi:hypothetical protein SNE40_023583 [Patella caerulea]|uniref:Farnesoic acid O-methyl transferase domain-containing protein n=2 Tax=Patella caerulea TaxID=87958 RepID=A0AAN8GAB1_PATCE
MAVLWCLRFMVLMCGFYLSHCEVIHLEAGSSYKEFRKIQNKESEMVWIKGCKDAVIGLFESTDVSSLVFELVIGGYGNKKTTLREKFVGVNMAESFDPDFMINPNQYTPFWIKWTSDTVYLRPGNMDSDGPVLQWTRHDTVSVRYMAFRTGYECPVKVMWNLTCSKVDITD